LAKPEQPLPRAPPLSPPHATVTDCIQMLVKHLVSDPSVKYMRKSGRGRQNLVDTVLMCMTEELQLLQQPLFNFLLSTMIMYDSETWTPQLSQILDTWLAFITPWGVEEDPRLYYPYIICNFPFYTVLVVQFLEMLCKMDIHYKFEQKSNKKQQSDTLNFLKRIDSLLGTIAALSVSDGNPLTDLLPGLEKRLLSRGRSEKSKLPFDCPELHSLLLGAHRALLPPDRPPHSLFPDDPQVYSRLFERLLGVFEPDDVDAVPAATSTTCHSIIKHCCTIFNQQYTPRSVRSPKSPRLSSTNIGKTAIDLAPSFKSQTMRENLPSWLPALALDNLPESLVGMIVSKPRRTQGWSVFADADDVGVLTERGKEQILRGQRVCSNLDVDFEGGEWDRPVRSWESAVMVVLSKWLSQYLNYKLGWESINLRFLASYRTHLCFVFFFLWCWLFLL